MNKIKDKMLKEFLENNAYFVDFFNAYFFNGEKGVHAMFRYHAVPAGKRIQYTNGIFYPPKERRQKHSPY